MLRKLNSLLVILSTSVLLVSCGGGNSKSDEENSAQALKDAVNEERIDSRKVLNIPPYPLDSDIGIDENKNNIRDDIENRIYHSLKNILLESSPKEAKGIYMQVIDITMMIQPKNPAIKDSINEYNIYCAYNKLPKDIQENVPLSFLFRMVLNTQQLKNNYNKSLLSTTKDIGEDACN